MADYIVKDTELTSVANAIRTAGGTNSLLNFPNGFVNAVNNISGGSSDLFYVKFSWDSQHNAFVADKSLEELTVAITEHNYILGSVNDSILTFVGDPISFTRTYCSVNTGVIQTLLPELDDEDELTGYWIPQTNTWQTTQQAG